MLIQLKKDDILSRFLQVTQTDPKYLRDIILNFIIAGKDTTAATLSWFIYALCKHPHIQEKISKEIKEVTDQEQLTAISEFTDRLHEAALEKMHYLHAALTETLRLYPALPVVRKNLSNETLTCRMPIRRFTLKSCLSWIYSIDFNFQLINVI